jgi:hypothetical protein
VRSALVALLASLVLASGASAADRVYWGSFATDEISWANLDGSGGVQSLNTGTATVNEPIGLALDPVGGRVYWANHTGGKVSWANLDGSGGGDLETGAATVSAPEGVAVDVAERKVYWVNAGMPKVSWANVDGSGGADLDTGAAPIMTPIGLTLFPASGRLYWANYGAITGFISYANIDGSGGGSLSSIPSEMLDTPSGVAIDAAAGRLYWTSTNKSTIYSANLDGTAAAELDDRGLEIKGPYGIALDTEAGNAYVAPTNGDSIMSVRLNGTGGASLPFEFEPDGANFASLLLTPRPRGAPEIVSSPIHRKVLKRRSKLKPPRNPPPSSIVGVALRCISGSWAPNLVEASLYRAPTSSESQLIRDGIVVAGDTILRSTTFGNFRCRETATNPAGGASQLSPVAAFFKIGGAKRNKKKGTAKLTVELPPEGVLKLSGKGLVAKQVSRSGKRKVAIVPKGGKRSKLTEKGEVRARAKLTFTPAGGPPVTQSAVVTLKKKIAP